MKLSDIEWIWVKITQFHSNSFNFTQFHSILLNISFNFIQFDSKLLEFGSIRVKQMTGHLHDWTHSDLYDSHMGLPILSVLCPVNCLSVFVARDFRKFMFSELPQLFCNFCKQIRQQSAYITNISTTLADILQNAATIGKTGNGRKGSPAYGTCANA